MPHSQETQPKLRNDQNAQLQRLADYIVETDLKPLPLPREFFYASLPLCIIDAVFSIGVTYTSTANTVTRFCDRQDWTVSLASETRRARGEHTITDLLALFENLTPDQAAGNLFGNRQRTSTRSGILKAEAVQRFAAALLQVGINDFCDFTADRLVAAKTLICEIAGQSSGISFDYFQMLAGDDTLIKPDRMVQRFIAKAIDASPNSVGPDLARDLLQGAVPELIARGYKWSPRVLDYAIWQMQRSNA